MNALSRTGGPRGAESREQVRDRILALLSELKTANPYASARLADEVRRESIRLMRMRRAG